MLSTIDKLTQEVASQLKQIGLNVATAESCTGGGLSYWLTRLSGSSDWFERGFVTYSHAAKIEMLGVREETLATYGAVSKETVIAMAKGALKASHAKIAVAITGIAGPTGGSLEKPVGTVWIATCKTKAEPLAKSFLFSGNREAIRLESICKALEMLLVTIKTTPI